MWLTTVITECNNENSLNFISFTECLYKLHHEVQQMWLGHVFHHCIPAHDCWRGHDVTREVCILSEKMVKD